MKLDATLFHYCVFGARRLSGIFRGHAALRRGQILQILDQANDLAMRVELTTAARG